MFIILGANGHVGSAVATALLVAGESVTAVVHREEAAAAWRARGAEAAVVDVTDSDALRAVLRTGRRAFLLNPPAATSGDTDVEEHRSAASIVAALDGSGLEQVVAQSAYGAQPGERIGDLSVLYDFEQALGRQPIPVKVQRGAYYMSNWDALLESARGGTLPTMLPADLQLPMVAPDDFGRSAAELLRAPIGGGMRFAEGPRRYSAQEVANAFAAALGHPVALDVIPRERWEESYRKLGFSDAAADAYARMTRVSVDGGFDMPEEPWRGPTTIRDYVAALLERA